MAYTPFNVTQTSLAPTRADNIGTAGVAGGAGTGLSFLNTGLEMLYVNNSAGNTPTFVIVASGTFKGRAVDESNNITQATAANADYMVGRLDPAVYNDSSGYVNIYFSGGNETDLKVIAWRP